MTKRVVVAITGATGSILAVRLLEVLKDLDGIETHLIVSPWGRRTLEYETGLKPQLVEKIADYNHKPNDMWSPLASGSFKIDAMLVVPCSMRTLAAIAHGVSDDLISRAADVAMKEHAKLVLVPRETPLNAVHLQNMKQLVELGVRLVPPMVAFYSRPRSVEEIVDHLVQRVLDQIGIDASIADRWTGKKSFNHQ